MSLPVSYEEYLGIYVWATSSEDEDEDVDEPQDNVFIARGFYLQQQSCKTPMQNTFLK